MPLIDQETKQKILDTADIVEVVSDFVHLRKSGANYKGLCPFHNERTPSFSVNKARNICKCFSCGKGGSPVNFIMEHEQMTFNEALRYLAKKYNIEIKEREMTEQERAAASKSEALMALNAFALKHFETNLKETTEGKSQALSYLRHRGMSDAMIERFHLGYAIDKGTDLLDAAKKAGFNVDLMVETGLEGRSQRDGSLYDRYRGRVIFPIHTLSGRVVGFGARTMRSDKTVAKYVNSPESEIYHKKKELYGMYQSRHAIARADKCIMVEGYFDVISMHQAGVENVVASSGTSLTEEQIRAIRRFTHNITLIYDGDAAGVKASLRGIKLLLAEDMNVKVLALPPEDDPDSFAQSHSSSEVETYLAEHETDIIAFMASKLTADIKENDPIGRANAINDILKTLAFVDDPIKMQEYISLCSRILNSPEDVLMRQLNTFRASRFEDLEKEHLRSEAAKTLPQTEIQQQKEVAEVPAQSEAPLQTEQVDETLVPFERQLIQYIVRYGLLEIDDDTNETGGKTSVFEMIENALAADGYSYANKQFTLISEAFREFRDTEWHTAKSKFISELDKTCAERLSQKREEIRARGGTLSEISKAERQIKLEEADFREESISDFDMRFMQTCLVNSSDDTVRRIASELLMERYVLSRIYSRQGNVLTEKEQLRTLVPRAVNELRSAVVASMIRNLNKLLESQSASGEDAIEIMQRLAQLKVYQYNLVKSLGERIIQPLSK